MSKKSNSVEFQQLLDYLYALQRLGIKVGIEHTQKLLDVCNNPQNNFKAIHIAGTNGKGSTAAMISSILREAGQRVGLYTSPHLIRFNERIRINGVPISDNAIVEFVAMYKSEIDKIESTFFEATTAMAFDYFSNNNVNIAIVETGLGGRLDSTNVLNPMMSIITPITSDHTEILGKDLKSIAFEKGGIIKEDIPLVLASQSIEINEVLFEIANQKNAKVIDCSRLDLEKVKISKDGTEFYWAGENYTTCLFGEHQVGNAVLAIEAVKLFGENISFGTINSGLKKVNWPARLQRMHKTLPIYYDVAHNPHGIQVVLNTLYKMYSSKPVGLIVLKADKELEQIVPKLKNMFQELIVSSVSEAGLMNAEYLHNSLKQYGIRTKLEPNIRNAIRMLNNQVSNSTPSIIFGSHYIGETIFKEYDFSFDNGII